MQCYRHVHVGCVQNDMGGEVAYNEFQTSADWLASHSIKALRLSLKDLVNKGKLLRCGTVNCFIAVHFVKAEKM